MTEEPSVDTQHPAQLKHTACNDWRRGCLPLGKNTRVGGGGSAAQMQNTTSSPTKPNGWGSINNSSGNNNPNKP